MLELTFKTLGMNTAISPETIKRLTPQPQKLIKSTGALVFDEKVKITLQGQSETAEAFPKIVEGAPVDFLLEPQWESSEFLEKIEYWLNFRLSEINSPFIFDSSQFSLLNTDLVQTSLEQIPSEGQREGYIVNANEKGITLQSRTYRGMYYGILTLSELFSIHSQGPNHTLTLPMCEIYDYPQYAIRGLVDDISRGQRPTIENFKLFIRFLSRTKQNLYVLYLEDMYKFEKYPQIGRGRGPLTKDDVIELQAYAKEWFVTIVPGFELLGHMDNMLTEPELMQYAEFPGAQCLDISSAKTRQFVRDLLQEIAPVFETQVFAPICDESFDFGLFNSREYVEKKGWGEALAEWYLFLIEEIQKVGKQMVLFAHDILQQSDVVMEAIQKQPAIVYYWDYADKKEYPKITKLRNKGLTVVGGPAVFDWSRHYPYYDYAETNMIYMGQDGLKRGSIGLVTTKWGDFFNENFRNNIFYGLAVNGQSAWSPFQSEVPQIREAWNWLFFGSTDERILQAMDVLSKHNKNLPRWPNGMFNRYWYDPFVRKIGKEEYAMAEQFITSGMNVRKTIAKIQSGNTVSVHKDMLDYMDFSAQMAIHYGVKILVSETTYQSKPEYAKQAQSLVGYPGNAELGGYQWLKDDIESQLPRYSDLWGRLAIPEGLEYPSQRFRVLAWHYERAIEDLNQRLKPHAHQLQSEWIWRSGKRTNIDWGNHEPYYFVKHFSVGKPIKKATAQAIANNYLEFALNGKEFGRVFSRFSLSQFPMAKAVQWFDVTKEIQEGKNLICVKGINYPYGIGGINITLHLEYSDNTTEDIISDATWQYSDRAPMSWPLQNVSENSNLKWKRVRSYGKPPGAWMGPITQPVWDKGWKSSISFIFGNRNFTDTAIRTQIGKGIYRFLFGLVGPFGRFFSKDMYILRK